MFSSAAMSNSTSNLSEEASVSSCTRVHDFGGIFINNNNNPVVVSTFSDHHSNNNINDLHDQQPQKMKKKRSLPGNPGTQILITSLSFRISFIYFILFMFFLVINFFYIWYILTRPRC